MAGRHLAEFSEAMTAEEAARVLECSAYAVRPIMSSYKMQSNPLLMWCRADVEKVANFLRSKGMPLRKA